MNKEDLKRALHNMGIVSHRSKYGAYFIIGKYIFSNAHVFENAEEMAELERLHSWPLTATKFFRPVSETVPDIAVAELESSNKAPAFNFFDEWPHDQECYCYINPMVNPEHEDWLTILEGNPINTAHNPIIFKCPNEKMPLGLSGAPLLHVKRKTPEGDEPFLQIKPAGVIYAKDEKNEHLYAVSLQAEMQQIQNLLQKRDEDDRNETISTYMPNIVPTESTLEPALNAYQLGHLSDEATFSPIAAGLTLLRLGKLTKTKLALLNDSYRVENKLSTVEALEETLETLLTRLLATFSDDYFNISSFAKDHTSEMRIDFEPTPRELCFEDNIPGHHHEQSSRFLAVKFHPSINAIHKDSVFKALFYSALYLQTVVISTESPISATKEHKAQPKDAKKLLQQQEKERKAANRTQHDEEKRTSKPHFEIYMHPNGNLHLDSSQYNRYNKKENNTDNQVNPSIAVIKSLFLKPELSNQKENQSFITRMKTLLK